MQTVILKQTVKPTQTVILTQTQHTIRVSPLASRHRITQWHHLCPFFCDLFICVSEEATVYYLL